MKHTTAMAVLAAAGGAAAFFLRLAQARTGLIPETGLSVPGNLFGHLLWVLLALLGVGLFLLARRLPDRRPDPRPFQDVFSAQGAAPLLLVGVFLLALSGGAEVRAALSAPAGFPGSGAPPAGVALACGGLTALSALCLLPVAFSAGAGRHSRSRRTPPPVLLLPAPVALVFHLVLDYRVRAANPALETYAPELLALGFAALAFFRLSSFAFEDGSVQVFSFFAGGSVVLCAAALAGNRSLSNYALLGGCALFFLGLLLSLQPGSIRRRAGEVEEEELP
ncbi:hypothetical protein [Oscillibacter sp. GMB15532]|uniref:hypothetical protein n=1 Tax=Oscillibacter sp. GMB15532 TaxID=3230022 RepID=UPI0034DF1318